MVLSGHKMENNKVLFRGLNPQHRKKQRGNGLKPQRCRCRLMFDITPYDLRVLQYNKTLGNS